jgi:hypothetical protein
MLVMLSYLRKRGREIGFMEKENRNFSCETYLYRSI